MNRATRGEEPLPDVNALAKVEMVQQLKDMVRSIQADDGLKVMQAYLDAPLDTQTQVKALLGVS